MAHASRHVPLRAERNVADVADKARRNDSKTLHLPQMPWSCGHSTRRFAACVASVTDGCSTAGPPRHQRDRCEARRSISCMGTRCAGAHIAMPGMTWRAWHTAKIMLAVRTSVPDRRHQRRCDHFLPGRAVRRSSEGAACESFPPRRLPASVPSKPTR